MLTLLADTQSTLLLPHDSLIVHLRGDSADWLQAWLPSIIALAVVIIGAIVQWRLTLVQLKAQRDITTEQLTAQRDVTATQLTAQREITERQITASVRTQSRLAWIDKVRSNVADILHWAIVTGATYQTRLETQESKDASEATRVAAIEQNEKAGAKFGIAYHSLRLLLDPDQPEEKALWDAAAALMLKFAAAPKTVAEIPLWRDSTGPFQKAVNEAALQALKVHHKAAIQGN